MDAPSCPTRGCPRQGSVSLPCAVVGIAPSFDGVGCGGPRAITPPLGRFFLLNFSPALLADLGFDGTNPNRGEILALEKWFRKFCGTMFLSAVPWQGKAARSGCPKVLLALFKANFVKIAETQGEQECPGFDSLAGTACPKFLKGRRILTKQC